jgi:hypothetical protein
LKHARQVSLQGLAEVELRAILGGAQGVMVG